MTLGKLGRRLAKSEAGAALVEFAVAAGDAPNTSGIGKPMKATTSPLYGPVFLKMSGVLGIACDGSRAAKSEAWSCETTRSLTKALPTRATMLSGSASSIT
jgi:hypothetical protein